MPNENIYHRFTDSKYSKVTNSHLGRKQGLNNIPVNTKHLHNNFTMVAQRRRRWADVVQMLFKYFVFAGITAPLENHQKCIMRF